VNCLLLVAHGSRMPETNEEIKRLVEGIRERTADRYDRVEYGFLEFAEPSFPEAFEACIKSGCEQIVVIPYLLAVGRHVTRDIPDLVRAKESEHPDLKVRLTPYVGSAEGMLDLVLSIVP